MNKLFLHIVLLFGCLSVTAQTMTENDHIRKGNKHYVDSLYEKAEIEYRKAIELNPQSVDAMYNLGNALFYQLPQSGDKAQEKAQEALQQYSTVAKLETDKAKLAQVNHNLGVLLYMAKQYQQSVEAYKEALRNDPSDNETRYNLAKAMHMLKQQQDQQQENQDQQQDQQQQQQQEQKQEQQQQNQEQQQQEQNQQQEQQEQQQQNQEQQQESQQQQGKQSEEQISKENAEQILNALMQDEKELQEKQQKKMQQQQGKTLEKDW